MPSGILALVAAAVASAMGVAFARADEERERRLERELEEVKRRLEAIEKAPAPLPPAAPPSTPPAAPPPSTPPPAAPPPAPSPPAPRPFASPPAPPASPGDPAQGDVELEPVWGRDALDTPAPLRGVYDKPFLATAWRRAYFGGYTELEHHSFRDDVLLIPRGFRAHRTNLFAFAEVADRVLFGAEIEFENEEPGEDLEVKVEMAFVDWVIFEELAVRAGAILVPLGRINVNHDGPARELTERPLVSTFVIPTTLTEAGIGVRGTIQVAAPLALEYEAYAVNGFALLDRDGELAAPIEEREHLLREGRPSLGGDLDSNLAFTGRAGIRAFGALQTGGSWHVGDYDERSRNRLSIVAADLALVLGPFALEGELAWAGFERDTFARTAGIPDRFWGFYVQGAVSGMPPPLRRAVPYIFDDEGAALGAVIRWDYVDLDGDRGEALEPGVTFRPVADAVFKLSYRFGLRSLGFRGVPGRRFDDDGFVFSLASYF